jgi:hypothetical protein
VVNPAVAVRPEAPLGILYPKGQVDVPAFLGAFSKAAFELLQRRYPTSDWAKKTKYWYGSER